MNILAGLFYGIRLFWGEARAGRNFKKYQGAILGIALCLVPLILVLEVTEGMMQGITDRYLEIGSFHFQVRSFFSPEAGKEKELIKALSEQEGVVRAFPFREGVALAWAKGKSRGVTVRAYEENFIQTDPGLKRYVTVKAGSLGFSRNNSILIAQGLAEYLQVSPGDSIRIVTGRASAGGGVILRPTEFYLEGVFSTGYKDLDKYSVIIPYSWGSLLFRETGSLGIGVKVASPYSNLDSQEKNLRKVLPGNWYIYSWYDLEKPMYKSFQTTKNLLTFIMVLILIVAGVNISGVTVMTVLEKQQEIAILKSTGVNSWTIILGFVTVGFLCGLLGTLLGVILGVLGALNINAVILFFERGVSLFTNFTIPSEYYLETIPIKISFKNLFFVSLFSLTLSLLASYFPSKRINRLTPLDILKKV